MAQARNAVASGPAGSTAGPMEEWRTAPDGRAYTRAEFVQWYGHRHGALMWDRATRIAGAEEPGPAAADADTPRQHPARYLRRPWLQLLLRVETDRAPELQSLARGTPDRTPELQSLAR